MRRWSSGWSNAAVSMNLGGRFPGGLAPQRRMAPTVWVAALPPGGLLVENAGEALLDATQDSSPRTRPRSYHPQMEVEPAGPIVTPIRNRQALERDLTMVAGAVSDS